MGATLAVLNTRHKIDLLLDYMRSHPQLRYKDLLYVGLTNQKWIPANSSTSFNNILCTSFNNILCNTDLNQYTVCWLCINSTAHVHSDAQ